jgi:hypothetical protein
VCESFPCVLQPCPQCGESFCAAHRFHGHEDAALQERLRRRAYPRCSSSPALSGKSLPTTCNVCALCAPFTSSHPLTLVPVGYRSRRMDLLALVVRVRPVPYSVGTSPSPVAPLSSSASTPSPSSSANNPLIGEDDIGVCSLVVATEMSVGQLRDRLEMALCSTPETISTFSQPLTALGSSIFIIAPTLDRGSGDGSQQESDSASSVSSRTCATRRCPTLSLRALPTDVILREAPILHAAVVLPVASRGVTLDDAALLTCLRCALTAYLCVADAPARRDARVKALSTRLLLQHQRLLRQSNTNATPYPTAIPDSTCAPEQDFPKDPPGMSANGVVGAAASADAVSPPRKLADPLPTAPVAAWPFRNAGPLNGFDFFNSKLSPCGAAAIHPSTAPRVVVALFIADTTLPCAVKPMCVALGRDWPIARVVDRLTEEVVEQQQQLRPHRVTVAPLLKTFSLFRLNETGEKAVGVLWDGETRTCAPSTAALESGEVLVLCPPAVPGAVVALEEEVQRLRCLTGKDKRALKADQIKLCSVM